MAEVGKREVRVDAFDKATGRTKYYEDLMPRDALYVRIRHSTIAHGFVKTVDKSAAEAIPGVVKVLTCFDVPEHPFPTAGHPWSMDPGHQDVADRHLLNRHVRYYGDDVAVVIAEALAAAGGDGQASERRAGVRIFACRSRCRSAGSACRNAWLAGPAALRPPRRA